MPVYQADTKAIKEKLYPSVEKSMSRPEVIRGLKKIINDFISNRTEDLYSTLPCSRIICSESEMNKLFDIMKISKADVKNIILKTYYGTIDAFKPLAAKHEFTVLIICIIRYLILNNKSSKVSKDIELAMIYLSFSGKFYPSIHYGSYPIIPVKHVMEYVVNNRISNKFYLVTEKSVIGAISAINITWEETYLDKFKRMDDEDVVYLIQQLHSRICSFMKNIATEYYDVYDHKDLYMSYTSDSYDTDNFHMADNDMLKVGRSVEKTITFINSNGIDYRICKMCSTADITTNECKAVIESIISNKENISEIKELISLMVALYFSTGQNDVSNINFITYTISPKPNAKQKEIVRMKEIIEGWLNESGTAYTRRKSRIATRNAYERAVRMYFALIIHNSNR